MQLEHDNVLPRFSSEYLIQSRETLETALYRTRAYAAWRELDPGPEADIEARYAALPWLTKQDIRNHFPDGFTPSDRDVEKGLASGEISFVSTSGTTDEVVTNIWNQKWWNASEKASWALHAVTASLSYENHSEAILASALSVGKLSDTKRLSSVERTIGHLHFLNECSTPLLWDEALLRRIVLELNTMQPEVLEANPSYLSRFCRFVAREGIEVKNPHVIVLTYELPTPLQLAQITEVFSCPVVSSYGSTETAYVFMECEAGRFHQNSEFCRIDFSPLPSQDGTSLLGRIAVTTFGNPWFYLLRFDIGDLVRLEPSGRCPCGRHSGYILSSIEGRLKGATYTAEGLLVTQAEAGRALSQISGIDDFQILQEAQDC
ncbi:MAG TPA: hypothetical protein PLG43_14170, partial [Spirochaetia bacterium]|nr:hypothetical protein [Spirochaetia bacterium]